MSSPTLPVMPPGTHLAFYTVLAHVSGFRSKDQIYRVQRQCCGVIEDLGYKRMDAHRRKGYTQCFGCRTLGRPTLRADDWRAGKILEPVTLLLPVGGAAWQVAWNCCGRIAEFGRQTLVNYHRDWERDHHHPCPDCRRKEQRADPVAKPLVDVAHYDSTAIRDLYSHIWHRVPPPGLTRNIWGHPWAP